MSREVKNHKLGWIALAGLLLVAILGFLPTVDRAVQAQTDNQLRGWAWSDNIGWISFNASNVGSGGGTYNVSLTENNELTGYAWSDNIGWIRFDPAYAGPNGSSWGAKIEGDALTGWARACAVFASNCEGTLRSSTENGGWDGWIEMTDVSVTTQTDGTRKLGGFAWGDINLGWVSFAWTDFGGGGTDPDCPAGVCLPPINGSSISCTVEPSTVTVGEPFELTASNVPAGTTNYEWFVNGTSENDSVYSGPDNPASASFSYVGTHQIFVSVDGGIPQSCGVGTTVTVNPACTPTGQSVPIDGGFCCEPDPGDEEDGICGLPIACEIELIGSNSMAYYNTNKPAQNLAEKNKSQIRINSCTPTGPLTIQSPDLDPRFTLICNSDLAAINRFEGSCDNLGPNQTYFVWVNPPTPLPTDKISQSIELQLLDDSQMIDAVGTHFLYTISAIQ